MKQRLAQFGWPLAALAALLAFNLAFSPGFFHIAVKDGRLFGSLIDVLHRATPVMLVAIGMTLVIATGGVDLSVGAVVAVAGAIATLMIKAGRPLPAAVVVALLAGLGCGLWNGVLVAYLEIQPIVATLILMVAGRGIAQLLTGGQIITVENKLFTKISLGSLAGLPFPVIIVALVLAVSALMTRRTAIGLFIESIGNNPTASRFAGINARFVKLLVYAFCGLCAAGAGLIVSSEIKAADSNNAGQYFELDAILAVVVGGTALTGGRFILLGSLIGTLIIQTLTTTILTRGVAVEFTLVVKALVVVAVCLLQSEEFRRRIFGRLARRPA